MNNVRETIATIFLQSLADCEGAVQETLNDDLPLLQSGLDSLGFAILVTQLERELGYDPFTLMEEAVYPSTYGEFVAIYLKYAPSE